jgi:hypothetical protein
VQPQPPPVLGGSAPPAKERMSRPELKTESSRLTSGLAQEGQDIFSFDERKSSSNVRSHAPQRYS